MPEPQSSRVCPAVRVLLADDHDILRQGLKLLLSLQPEITVVGEARTGRETVAQTLHLQPEVVVLDISMPDMDGLEACRQIRARAPASGVLMLTMHESEDYFLQALRAGAAGYLVKRAAPPDVQMAIMAVARGEVFLYPGLARALVNAYTATSSGTSPAENRGLARQLRVLSARELEVLTLVARGYTNREIAEQLVLSIKTVQAHRASVMARLGLENVAHLVRFAMRSGLLPSDI
jgi:DNA-binding NarL/FixJ family response regulator